MLKNPKLIANLPVELVEDILVRLPVEPLLRFRCVSKQWHMLIGIPNFIKLHINRSKETRNNRSLIVQPQYSGTYLIIHLDSSDVAIATDHPLNNSKGTTPLVMGSCNGLVLLDYAAGIGHDDIVIWNPFTRNYHELPAGFNSTVPPPPNIAYRIGYDSVHDDYKVVKIIQFDLESDDPKRTEVEVYSLKSNTWRRIHDFPYYLREGTCDVVLSGGALHWIVYDNNQSSLIAAFDLASEECRLVPMLNANDNRFCYNYMNITVLEGCLCILYAHGDRIIDVWVMKSYRVSESWTKLISVSLQIHNHEWDYETPLAFSKDGREVLFVQNHKSLIWYDLESKARKMAYVHGLPGKFHVEFVTQSLVPLPSGSGTYAYKQKQYRNGSKNRFGRKALSFF